MAYQAIDLSCPGCGGGVSTSMKLCIFCNRPVVITSFSDFSSIDVNQYQNAYNNALTINPNNDALNMSLAMCFLKDEMYDEAISAFRKAIESTIGNPEVLFYASVALLRGKKAFLADRKTQIDEILKYLNVAIKRESKGIYHYFLAYIKYDYFERKCLNITPNWEETLLTAIQSGASSIDVSLLAEMLKVEIPKCLNI